MSQSGTSEERKDGLLTIILHVQRLGRIVVVDPSPIIQKPMFVLFCFFTHAPETKRTQVSNDTVNMGGKKKEKRKVS
jgi:hypothetical protein